MRITVVLNKYHENILAKHKKMLGITQTEVIKRALESLSREEIVRLRNLNNDKLN